MANKGTILVGTIGQGVMMSADDGESWTRASVRQGMHSDCIVRALLADPRRPNVGIPRPTGIAIDPTDHRHVWVGLEVDGVRHSADGGETWTKVNGQIPNQDVHNVLVVAGPPKTVFTVVNDDVWRSTDDGKTWD